MPLEVAVIGANPKGIGFHHCRTCLELELDGYDIRLVATSRRTQEGVDETLKKLKESAKFRDSQWKKRVEEVEGYSDCREMIIKKQPNAVIVCSYDRFHLSHMWYTLENDRNIRKIFCEKNLSTREEVGFVEAVIKDAEKKNVDIAVNSPFTSIKKQLEKQKAIFGGQTYQEVVKNSNYFIAELITAGSNDEKKSLFEDLFLHAINLVPKEPRNPRIVEENESRVEIDFYYGEFKNHGRSILGYSSENKRKKWFLCNGGKPKSPHSFEYRWEDGKPCVIYEVNGNKQKIDIVDPLKDNLVAFFFEERSKKDRSYRTAKESQRDLGVLIEAYENRTPKREAVVA